MVESGLGVFRSTKGGMIFPLSFVWKILNIHSLINAQIQNSPH